jgi:hypothetical protein
MLGTRQYIGSAQRHGATKQQPRLKAAVNGTFVGRLLRGMTIWPTSSSSIRTDRVSHDRADLVA